MGISKITRNYQIIIPKYVRELKGLREGDSIIFFLEGNKVEIIKADKNIIQEATGIWETKEIGVEYEDRIRKGWKRRFKREMRE